MMSMLVFGDDENNFDLLEKTLVLLVVEELLLLEALLQEVNLTIKTTMMIKDWSFTSSGLSES